MKFTLDSNVLVDAVRSPAAFEAFEEFVGWARHRVFLSAVVVAELEAGARSETVRDRLATRFLAPFERHGRVLAPTTEEWKRAGRLLSAFDVPSPYAIKQNDTLLAVQARSHGWVVITRDRDFDALRVRVAGLQVAEPYPTGPRP